LTCRKTLKDSTRDFTSILSRKAFDNWLISMIPPGVDMASWFIPAGIMKKQMKALQSGICINGKTFTEKCRYLVGADGATSRVREILSGRSVHSLPSYIALQQWFISDNPDPYFSVFFNNDLTDFYSWIIPKENTFCLGAALPYSNNIKQAFNSLKKQCSQLGYNFAREAHTESAWIIRPTSGTIMPGSGRIMLIGEAAGLISPSSAEGISYSLRSAQSLSNAFLTDGAEPSTQYHSYLKGLMKNILIKNLKAPFMYNHVLRGLIMKTGISSMNYSDDDMPHQRSEEKTATRPSYSHDI
jgi:geranylgeranyl reductase